MIAFSKSANRPALALITGVLALASAHVHSQTNPPSPASLENRFLVIVETSRAMEKRAAGLAGTVDHLLRTGIQGQARPGDTIGLWTFNNSLHAGEFPLKTWSRDLGTHVSSEALRFLADQKLAKQPRFDCVIPALAPLIKDSPFITILIITSGTDTMKGTPFDKQINKALAGWREEQQKAQMPLVVVLRAAHGTYTHYTVTPAPWQPEIPPLPAELVYVKPRKPATLPAQTSAQTSSVPSLIVSGKRTPSAAPVASAPVAASTNKPVLSSNPQLPATASTTNSAPVAISASAPATPVEPPPVSPTVETPPVSPTVATPLVSSTVLSPLVVHAREMTPPSTQSPSEPVAVITPPLAPRAVLPKVLMFGGLLLIVFLVLALIGRSRESHVSLITHSIDHGRK